MKSARNIRRCGGCGSWIYMDNCTVCRLIWSLHNPEKPAKITSHGEEYRTDAGSQKDSSGPSKEPM
jgi:hypothetical protein